MNPPALKRLKAADLPGSASMVRASSSDIVLSSTVPLQTYITPASAELDVGIDPCQYLELRGYNNQSALSAMLSTSPAQQCFLLPPSTCGSLTEDTATDAAGSTVPSESYHGSLLGTTDMVHINSQDSFAGFSWHDCSLPKRFSGEQAILGVGTGYQQLSLPTTAMEVSISLSSSSSLGYPATNLQRTVSTASAGAASQCFSTDMERSVSNASARSAASLSARAKDALRRQNSWARRSIQPRAPGRVPVIAETRDDSAASVDKKEIGKTKYTRPKHEKLKCNLCNKYPQGFRGEHELRRHKSAKHSLQVAKFVCRDPCDVGKVASIDVIVPLSHCKQCSAGKKYGAYYNAAAHLRRSHFKRKAPRKGCGHVIPVEDDASVCWPPMCTIKEWIEEVVVPARSHVSMTDVEEDDVEEIDSFDGIASCKDGEDLPPDDGQQSELFFTMRSALPCIGGPSPMAFDSQPGMAAAEMPDLLSRFPEFRDGNSGYDLTNAPACLSSNVASWTPESTLYGPGNTFGDFGLNTRNDDLEFDFAFSFPS